MEANSTGSVMDMQIVIIHSWQRTQKQSSHKCFISTEIEKAFNRVQTQSTGTADNFYHSYIKNMQFHAEVNLEANETILKIVEWKRFVPIQNVFFIFIRISQYLWLLVFLLYEMTNKQTPQASILHWLTSSLTLQVKMLSQWRQRHLSLLRKTFQ